jgi:AraC-like DNA-binding protein
MHGANFTEVLAAAKRTMACDLLEKTDLPVAGVGRAIGYADAANFGRAFRQWTGRSPRAWRKLAKRRGEAR